MIAWLKMLLAVGLALGAVLTGLGWLAEWWPALDIFNNGLPALAAGSLVLVLLALLTRDWRAIALAGLLAAINIGLIFAGLQGAAAEATPGSKRFLRVATFNVWFDNYRIDGIDRFLNDTDADVVVLQEVTKDHLGPLHRGLDARYPYNVGDFGIVIFSKYPINGDGRVDRPGYPEWIRLLARWVELDVNGTAVELVGVHLAPALLSRAPGTRRHEPDPVRAHQETSAHRGRRFQHDAVDRPVEAIHPHNRARPIQ